MSVTESMSISVQSSLGTQTISGVDQEVGNTEIAIAGVAFPSNSNAAFYSISFNAAATQLVFLNASQNCTIGTNNGVSPSNIIKLVAGLPMFWGASANGNGAGYPTNPFTSNVTNGFFVTCNSAVILNGRIVTT